MMATRSADRVVAMADRQAAAADYAATAAQRAYEDARLTVAEAAADARVGMHTIRRAYTYGHLRVQRFGIGQRALRIVRRDLRAWLEAGGRTHPPDGVR